MGLCKRRDIFTSSRKIVSDSSSGLNSVCCVEFRKCLEFRMSVSSVPGLLHTIPVCYPCSPVLHRNLTNHPAVCFVMQKKCDWIDARMPLVTVGRDLF